MLGSTSHEEVESKNSSPYQRGILSPVKSANFAMNGENSTRKKLPSLLVPHPQCKSPCELSTRTTLSRLELSELVLPTSIDSDSPGAKQLTPLVRVAISAHTKARQSSPTASPSLPMPEHFSRLRSQFSAVTSDSFSLEPSAHSSIHSNNEAPTDPVVPSPASHTSVHELGTDANAGSQEIGDDQLTKGVHSPVNSDALSEDVTDPALTEGATHVSKIDTQHNPSVPRNLKIYMPDPDPLVSECNRQLDTPSDVWIFGYGSLIWRPDVEYTESYSGHVRNSIRRFWQASPDHRGTPEVLGRVVTMMVRKTADGSPFYPSSLETPSPESPVSVSDDEWEQGVRGAVFKLSPNSAEAMLDRLCRRESAGYSAIQVEVICEDNQIRTAWCFSADDTNEFWTGDEHERDTSAIIATSKGPSGRNIEYFLRLLLSMRKQNVVDPHLERLWIHMVALQSLEDFDTASPGQSPIVDKTTAMEHSETEVSTHCPINDPLCRWTRAAVNLASIVLSPDEVEVVKSVNADILSTVDIDCML